MSAQGIIRTNSTICTERNGVGLGSTSDSGSRSGIKEQVGIVRGVLGLDKTVELTVSRSLLAEDGIQGRGWVRAEVRRGVLLGLAVPHGRSDHLGPSSGIELTRSVCRILSNCPGEYEKARGVPTNDLVSHILLRTFWLGSQ